MNNIFFLMSEKFNNDYNKKITFIRKIEGFRILNVLMTLMRLVEISWDKIKSENIEKELSIKKTSHMIL